MNIKKGLTLTAFGFLFLLVNFNLTINGSKLNVTPDFIGWILLTMAFSQLGSYVKGRKYLVYISLIMAIISGAHWAIELFKPELLPAFDAIQIFINVMDAVYMFVLFGVLKEIAHDNGSIKEATISTLRYVNLAVSAILVVVSLLAGRMNIDALASIVAIVGVIGLVAAVISAVTLFKLKKDLN